MEHQGPNPQLNRQKRDTAAEQLTKLQDEYEARGQPSSDKMQPVLTHNEHPKLSEQLKKRKSDVHVSDMDKARTPHASRSKKRSGQTKRGSRGTREKNLTRVNKKRSHYCVCSKCSSSKFFSTKSCQFANYVTVINRRIGTEVSAENDATVAPMAVSELAALEPPKNESFESVPVSIGSNITSVSSLNSYYSMDHEPMVRSSKRK